MLVGIFPGETSSTGTSIRSESTPRPTTSIPIPRVSRYTTLARLNPSVDDSANFDKVHAVSKRHDAIPLILAHGWPGSIYEFNQVWGPLSNPSDPSVPAFHVVVPSLPGFGWSDWPPKSAWTLQDTARIVSAISCSFGLGMVSD